MEKKRIKELLGDKQDHLEVMINTSPSCLKIIDKEGHLLSMNRRGLDLIEAMDLDSVLGADVYEIVHPEHRKDFQKFNEKVCNGSQGSLRFRIIGLRGTERWMETHAGPYYLANGDIAHIAITNDISESVKNQETLQEQERIIRESAKLAELGKLAGNIAHELNNPLMVITGNSRQIFRTLDKGDNLTPKDMHALKDYAEKIQNTVQRMSRIIKGLKTFSHDSKEVNTQVVCIDTIIDDSIAISQEKFKSMGIFVERNEPSHLNVNVCPVQISQVIVNLINNSFDAIHGQERPWIKIQVEKVMRKVVILISDSGNGIAPELQGEIMNPFFTTKDVGKGTGLGLSISLGIIKSHGGDFYYNPKSPFTQFIIELPLVAEKSETERQSA